MNHKTRPLVLIIASKDDLDAGWERAQVLKKELERLWVPAHLVNKLGFDLEDLHLVARHRVVSTPTTLLLDGETVLMRKLGLPTARTLVEVLQSLRERAQAQTAQAPTP